MLPSLNGSALVRALAMTNVWPDLFRWQSPPTAGCARGTHTYTDQQHVHRILNNGAAVDHGNHAPSPKRGHHDQPATRGQEQSPGHSRDHAHTIQRGSAARRAIGGDFQ
jgi:hypothetical protein